MINLRLIFLLTITWCPINLAFEYLHAETKKVITPYIPVQFFRKVAAPIIANGKNFNEIDNINDINGINEYIQNVKPLSEKILGQYFKKKPYYMWEPDTHVLLVVSAILIASKYYDEDNIWNEDVISKKNDIFPRDIIPALKCMLFFTEADILKTIDWRIYKLEQELTKE
jgi:hypothetical protein